MPRRHIDWDYAGLVILVLAIVATLIIWNLDDSARRHRCVDGGGHVVELENVRYGWFCEP